MSASNIKVADYIFQAIQKQGVDFVPIYQSGNALHLINAVGKNKKLREFVNYHEQANGLAAEAYGRFKKLGVCCVGAGPAATNLSSAVMSAYCDSIPSLFVTGQVGMFHNKLNRKIRQRGFQEVDVQAHMKPITKYSVMVKKVENIRFELEKCIYLATNGRPGPVVIDVPYNIQVSKINPNKLKSFKPPIKKSKISYYQSISKQLLNEIDRSKKPLILLGGGAQNLKNNNLVLKLLNKLNIPVATTWQSADMLYYDFPLNMGCAGRSGNRSAVYSIQECDLLVSFGCRFTTKVVINEKTFASKARKISFDIDKYEFLQGLIKFDKGYEVDLKEFLPALNKEVSKKSFVKFNKNEWNKRISTLKKEYYKIDETIKSRDKKYISPFKFINQLFLEAKNNAIFIPDAGMNITWTYQANMLKKGQRIFTGLGASPMGYALPASVGAYYATKSDQTIVLAGDGGFQMNIQELQAVAFHKLPIKIIILNNESLGNTRFPAQRMFGNSTGNDNKGGYGWPDFVKVAKSYGIEAMNIKNSKNLKPQIRKVLRSKKPILVDVRIDPKQFMLDTPI